jgi:hypothetical protein
MSMEFGITDGTRHPSASWSTVVDVHGAVGSGKTVVVSSLLQALNEVTMAPRSRVVFAQSGGMTDQLRALAGSGKSARTGVVLRDTRAARVNSPDSPFIEKIEVSLDGASEPDIHIGAFPGEALVDNGGLSPASLAHRYNTDETALLVAVFNPYSWSEDIARRALFSFTGLLLEKLDLPVYDALMTAVRQLFGAPESALTGLGAKADAASHHGALALDPVVPELPEICSLIGRLRIEYDPSEQRDVRRMFPAVLETSDAERIALAEELYLCVERVVKACVADRAASTRALAQVVRGVKTACVVCLTHMDLRRWTPAVSDADIDIIEEQLEVGATIGARAKILLKQVAYSTEFNRFSRRYPGDPTGVARKPTLVDQQPLMGRQIWANILGRHEELARRGVLGSKPGGSSSFGALPRF